MGEIERPRRGSVYLNRWGSVVSRREHTFRARAAHATPPSPQVHEPQVIRQQLEDVAGEGNPGSFIPSRRIQFRFDLGEPVATKPAYMNTIVGRVDFPGDLLSGFNRVAPPTSRKEAWNIVEEAALRYAKLTAFIMAEQNVDAVDMPRNHMLDRRGVKEEWYDPRDVVAAVEDRRLLAQGSDDQVAERVILALSPKDEEKRKLEMISGAAAHYRSYLEDNAEEIDLGARNIQFVLRDALETVDEHDRYGWLAEFNNHPERLNSYGTAADYAREQLEIHIFEEWEAEFLGSGTRPFIEDDERGLRINLSEERYLRFLMRFGKQVGGHLGWSAFKVLRCVEEDGQEVVLGGAGIPYWYAGTKRSPEENAENLKKLRVAYLTFCDYSRPMAHGWAEDE